MELEEIRKEREKQERVLFKLLTAFEKKTGIGVRQVRINRDWISDKNIYQLRSIHVNFAEI